MHAHGRRLGATAVGMLMLNGLCGTAYPQPAAFRLISSPARRETRARIARDAHPMAAHTS